MQNTKLWIQRFFSIITLIFLGWIIFTFLASPRIGAISSFYRLANPASIVKLDALIALITLSLVLFGLFVYKRVKIHLTISTKASWLILILELVVYVLFLMMFVNKLHFIHSVDDAQVVFNWTLHHHSANPWSNPTWLNHYMYSNPQNIFLSFIYRAITTLFGSNFYPVIMFFIGLHAATALLLFGTLHQLGLTNIKALLVIQLFLLMPQIALQAPIAYTDTLSLFFIALTLLTLLIAEKEPRQKTALLWFFFSSVSALFAFLSKGTSLILIIAMVVFLFFHHSGKAKLLSLVPLCVFILGNFGWKQTINVANIYPDTGYGQPNTHYVMMGMSQTPIPSNLGKDAKQQWMVGIYSSADQAYSWNLFYNQRLPKKMIMHKQLTRYFGRLRAMRPKQLLAALSNKISVVWGTGDLKTSFSFARGMKDPNRGVAFFSKGKWAKFFYCLMTATQLAMYFGIVIGILVNFRRYNHWVLFSTVFLSGYFVFMLLWEVNPRYAIAIVPTGILLTGMMIAAPVTNQPPDISGLDN